MIKPKHIYFVGGAGGVLLGVWLRGVFQGSSSWIYLVIGGVIGYFVSGIVVSGVRIVLLKFKSDREML